MLLCLVQHFLQPAIPTCSLLKLELFCMAKLVARHILCLRRANIQTNDKNQYRARAYKKWHFVKKLRGNVFNMFLWQTTEKCISNVTLQRAPIQISSLLQSHHSWEHIATKFQHVSMRNNRKPNYRNPSGYSSLSKYKPFFARPSGRGEKHY